MTDTSNGATTGDAVAAAKLREPQDRGEVWRDIPGFPDYQVSNFGRVISVRRGKPHVLKPTDCSDGHLQVELFGDCKRLKIRVGAVVS